MLQTTRNDTTLELANKIFAEDSFQIEQAFRDIAVNDFDADIETVEFLTPVPTAKIINDWVSENTHGRIPSLVPEGKRTGWPRTQIGFVLENHSGVQLIS